MGIDFRILGELEVLQDGAVIDLGSPRQRALLARFLVSPAEVVSTDRLIEDLWRGEPPEAAKHTLHVYISRLRKALGPDRHRLERYATGYRLTVDDAELDASRFEAAAARGRDALEQGDAPGAAVTLREALELWRGTPLAEFADDAFARDEAIRLEEQHIATVEQRLWADLECGQASELVAELRELVTEYPLREVFWEQLMLALYRSGRQSEALRVFQSARISLAEELGIEPGAALRQLEAKILAQDPSLAIDEVTKPTKAPSTLPLQRTSFVGRTEELARVAELLFDSRLLTLVGPPGSGKTRLALQLALEQQGGFAHGAFFIPLATIDDPDLLAATIAIELGVQDVPGEAPLDTVTAFLADRHVLLVLDNFEQLLAAATQVGHMIDGAPGLSVLVTSRSPLRLNGEQQFLVPPMHVPPADAASDPSTARTFDAVTLFETRARAADPDFEVDAHNSAAVAQITALVDGLPLAIELAAARVRLLSPSDLLHRLDRRLSLLTDAPTDVDPRHRTMQDAIAWSYELLEPDEQTLFRGLGAFVGGFTLEAAEYVSDHDEITTLNAIDSLLTQNLLYRPVTVGEARYSMLQLTREYARELLDASGDSPAVLGRHAQYYAGLVAQIEPELSADPGGPGTQRLEVEMPNLRVALRSALDDGLPDLGLEIAAAVWRFWQSSERLTEGRQWLAELLDQPTASSAARAKGLTALAGLAYWQADYAKAWDAYSELLTHYRSVADRVNEADTLYAMSLTAFWRNQADLAEELATESRSLFEQLGSREGAGRAMCAQASALWWKHDYQNAYDLWVESIDIAREFNDQALVVTQLAGLAALTYHLGRRGEALEVAVRGLAEARQAHNAHVTVWMLDLIAAFAAPASPEDAVRLASAVAAFRESAGGGVLPEYLQIPNATEVAEPLLAAEAMSHSWDSGRTLDLDAAVELAGHLGSVSATL